MTRPIAKAALFLCLTPALCACNPGSQGSATTPTPTHERARSEAYAEAPAGAEAIAGLLGARHSEDLPDADTLAAHPESEASLRWLAAEGESMALRVRATESLRFYSSEPTRELLVGLLADETTHPALRAAAITGTGGLSLGQGGELRGMLEVAQTSEDPRVHEAAEARLADELAAP